jgi:DNA (cytosine-5)-methyltransferase 1
VRALDLFCGAGLSSAGARAGGATLVGAIDLCPIATATYSANFPGAKVINKPLEDVVPSALRRQIGNIDLLLVPREAHRAPRKVAQQRFRWCDLPGNSCRVGSSWKTWCI